jgi:hypothetical protein
MLVKNFFCVILWFIILLTGCINPEGDNDNNSDEDNNDNDVTFQKISVGYLSNFVVDIEDATGLGILRGNSLVSPDMRSATGAADKNYLVKTTTAYTPGSTEWGEGGMTKVAFIKTTAETVTIPVYDAEGNLIGNEPVENGETITQEKIQCQVNRLYVYNAYTFIQFVSIETAGIDDVRPAYPGNPDSNGYYEYDRQNYYNDDYHQTFVIENNTGNIYPLDNDAYIETIHNGLLKIKNSPYIYDCRIKGNNELEIFSLFQNTTVTLYDYYKDKYGNNYIYNNTLDAVDAATNTIYFKRPEYIAATSGEVVHVQGVQALVSIPYNPQSAYFNDIGDSNWWADLGISGSYPVTTAVTGVSVMTSDCASRAVTEMDDLKFPVFDGYYGKEYRGISGFSHIKDKKLFFIKNYSGYFGEVEIVALDTDTAAVIHAIDCSLKDATAGLYSESEALNYNTVLIQDYVNGKVYYYKIDYSSVPTTNNKYTFTDSTDNWAPQYLPYVSLYGNGLVLLFEDFDMDTSYLGHWEKNTISGKVEYMVALKDIGGEKIPAIIKVSEYVAEEQQVITLKPINR